jgi:hypothetical protein
MDKYLKKLVWLDIFPKVDVGYRHSTPQGGILSAIVSFFLFLLVIAEFVDYQKLHHTYEFLVDHDILHNRVLLHMDMTIAMKCECKLTMFSTRKPHRGLMWYVFCCVTFQFSA